LGCRIASCFFIHPKSSDIFTSQFTMAVAKKTRKFGAVKRMIGRRDARLQKVQDNGDAKAKQKETGKEIVRAIPQVSSSLFFQYNTALVPPYSVLVDVSN
jgi:U3 small nucleolar RNA-associated protein 24